MDHDLPGSEPHYTERASTQKAGVRVELAVGDKLLDRYEVRRRVGIGGMAAVYAAYDRTLGKEVALKILLPELLEDADARARFLDEGRIASDLSHPNIANVYDVREDRGFHFLAMELLQGRTLREEIDARRDAGRRFELDLVRRIGAELAQALAYAHRVTVHRDVKPENIFLCSDGTVKLMDFGIAQLVGRTGGRPGASLGTAHYASPEQVREPGRVDPRSDQYSLAAVLYELLTRQPPVGVAPPIRESRPDVPRSLAAAIERALAPAAGSRFADMESFGRALTREGVDLRDPRLLAAGAAALVALIAAIVWLSSGGGGPAVVEGDPRKQALEAQGVALALRGRLEQSRQSLAQRAREAERAEGDEAVVLRETAETVERTIFGGAEILALEGKLTLAADLIRSSEFAAARDAYAEIRQGSEALLARIEATESAHRGRFAAAEPRQAWERIPDRDGLELDEAAQAAAAWQAAESAFAQADYAMASAQFERARAAYAQAVALAPARAAEIASGRAARAEESRLARYAAQLVALPGAGFAIDRTEVTASDYAECVSAGGCSRSKAGGLCNAGGRGNHPANCVTLRQAASFCAWAGKRLPSDSEWARAAGGSERRAYPWGAASASCERAIVGNPSGDAKDGCGRDSTWPVGSRPSGATPEGAQDLAGNVAEWTAQGTARGGDWLHPAGAARVASLEHPEPDAQKTNIGFRCAR